ncbi:hypothetical protein N7499_009848 [Penicillium canescens]|uniref:Uncharacterized protein n=1 Tax=Penicillium canescens TaxID=5083 RepID=A0AAD6IQ11_PENCN|nr:uncharacterized protein N7446_008138 [Penicillium canescens]KAJ6033571.1 hypothetical protein N7444_011342 [Penicillium canescens]KAJ6057239.1 hypothetical protein N7460_000513 [Penicillium canescens]KAJ6058555.1 hypothetical protein N7446_008138 [Penicillium canescens]KAJ6071834.1 hypothetical protein N7499_009848 [Penicillium canescens]KAJ6170509.1 hypothetical protein N7485_007855 [Penicillium canescens]
MVNGTREPCLGSDRPWSEQWHIDAPFTISPSGRLLPHEHLARSAAYKASSASTSVRHGEQCLLYLVLGNAGIQPALTEWISVLQLAGGAPSQPLPGFRPRAHRSSGAEVDLAAFSIKSWRCRPAWACSLP